MPFFLTKFHQETLFMKDRHKLYFKTTWLFKFTYTFVW